METSDKLDLLYGFQLEAEKRSAKKAELIASVMPPLPDDIRKKIADIEAEFAPVPAAQEKIDKLRSEIMAEVKVAKATVHGHYLMAVWSKGRTGGYDTAKLDGYAAAHPEIKEFKNADGSPTVSIQAVRKQG